MTPAYIARKLVSRLGRELSMRYADARMRETSDPHRHILWQFVHLFAYSATDSQIARLRLQLVTKHGAYIFRREYRSGVRGAFSYDLECPYCARWEDVQEIERHAERCHQLRQRALRDIDGYAASMALQLRPAAA